jgi:hypothetical protein
MQGYTWKEVQRVVHCQTCGAELTMTRHLARQCVFCGSTNVLVEDNPHVFEQPDGFLPFKLDEQQAAAAIHRVQRSTMHRLRTWWVGQKQEVKGLQAVYLPFWVFDGFVEVRSPVVSRLDPRSPYQSSMRGQSPSLAGLFEGGASMAERLDHPASGGPRLSRELMMFDNLLFSAMDFPPPSVLKKIMPFELGALVPYEPRLLADWPAALYRQDVEEAVEDAYDTMLSRAVWRSGSLAIAHSTEPALLRRSFQVTTVTYQLVLLPVWVGLVQREDHQRLVVVNGQGGKVTFSARLRRKS